MTRRTGFRILALATDAFGGHGGIAQYNRDFLSALSRCEGVEQVFVLPRAGESQDMPSGVRQLPPVRSRIAYSFVALALFAYVVSVARRLGSVQQELNRLESELKRSGRT